MSFVPTNFRPFARTLQFRSVSRRPGASVKLAIAGVTRNSAGTALANCEVDLFLTGGDLILARTVSDATGNYIFESPGSGPFYVLAYLPGSPDVAGTTVRTLAAT